MHHHSHRHWIRGAAIAGATIASLAGCGKQGPPLAPYVRIPAAVEKITAHRVGNEVYLSITVPAKNIDASIPAAISRLEVYGYTGRVAPSTGKWFEIATLVATVPIAPPPPPAPAAGSTQPDAAAEGTIITVRDVLTAEAMEQGRTVTLQPRGGKAIVPAAPAGPLLRFYMAVAFGPRGRLGPPGAAAEVPLSPLPDPPFDLRASYTAAELRLEWEPSGGTLGYLVDSFGLPPEAPPLDEYDDRASPAVDRPDALPPGPTFYNVYRVLEPDPLAPLAAATSLWNAPPPAPLNAAPLAALKSTDIVQFDRRGCYTVRAVRGTGARAVESDASNTLCVTPIDIFPPSPPRSLAAVTAGQAISLIWEPGDEPDVAGYLVLRGEAGDATLQTLTPSPIAETRYRDASVRPGATYVYAVVAVDRRLPLPNVSAESNRVEETAR